MTATTLTPTDNHDVSDRTGASPWEGRVFGGIVLAAFLLYGLGSSLAGRPIGLALVALNSVAVAIAGLIGFRLLGATQPRVGVGYLVARIAEAVLLSGGIALSEFGDTPIAGDAAYQLAMLALGVGSVPFFATLGRENWLPQNLAAWGVLGYAALAAGALLELLTDWGVGVAFALPGGLFELTVALFLLRRGFLRRP